LRALKLRDCIAIDQTKEVKKEEKKMEVTEKWDEVLERPTSTCK
jgi:hypothetical protein